MALWVRLSVHLHCLLHYVLLELETCPARSTSNDVMGTMCFDRGALPRVLHGWLL